MGEMGKMGNHQQIKMGNEGTTPRVRKKWARLGEQWEKNGRKYPSQFHAMFPEAKDLPPQFPS